MDESDCCAGSIRLLMFVDELDVLDVLGLSFAVSAAKHEILKLSATINKTLVNIIKPLCIKKIYKNKYLNGK
ncbi:hypothetical protein [Nitrosomonas communis]|uniref:hypothetical protein n=1 Tax=Nitrosomonas communis TaxID=44574 RepID=UPI0011606C67|nr:hypothetical protein [Nitrosomonas communis]